MMKINQGTTSIAQTPRTESENNNSSVQDASRQAQRPAVDTWETPTHSCPGCPHPATSPVNTPQASAAEMKLVEITNVKGERETPVDTPPAKQHSTPFYDLLISSVMDPKPGTLNEPE